MTEIKIKTKGMHCASCEFLVKDDLEELDGVKRADASCETGIISVEFDESKVKQAKIEKTITELGYEVL